MANTKSAIKDIAKSRRQRVRNMSVRSAVKTAVTRARQTIAQTPKEALQTVQAACRGLDKAASKGVVHPNTAARRKSRLAKRVNAAAK